jgi:molybdopterin/thiamine biosynthesis adenylyltransferase
LEQVAKNLVFNNCLGSTGCELLKLYALCGVSTTPSSRLHIIDPGSVSISNITKQLLYRRRDIGEMKTKIIPKSLYEINPQVKVTTSDAA